MKESDFPALYEAADTASKTAQRQFLWTLGANFVLLVVAATMSVVNYPDAGFAIVQASLLAASLGLSIYLAVKQPQRIWYGTRALAESVKTVSWRFIMRAEPFNTHDEEAHNSFVKTLKKIFDANTQVSAQAVKYTKAEVVKPAMLRLRAETLVERRENYKKYRIKDQQEWYARKAKWNKDRATYWFIALIAANAVALIFAFTRIHYPLAEHWPTDIFVAIAASLMGWVQTKRFQELSASYTLTAHEIMLLGATMPKKDDEELFSSFVGDAENAFSREHTQWQARRDTE